MDTIIVKEFGHIPNVESFRDSMQLDSGQTLVWMEGTFGKYKFCIEEKVYGKVDVTYKDNHYKCASQMPEELLDMYKNGINPYEATEGLEDEYETPYYCFFNNWLEECVQVDDADGNVVFEDSSVVDIPEDNSPEGWKSVLLGIMQDIIKENIVSES